MTLTACPTVPRMALEPGILAHGGVGRGQRDFHMNPLGQAAGRAVGLLTLGTGRVGDGRRPERLLESKAKALSGGPGVGPETGSCL